MKTRASGENGNRLWILQNTDTKSITLAENKHGEANFFKIVPVHNSLSCSPSHRHQVFIIGMHASCVFLFAWNMMCKISTRRVVPLVIIELCFTKSFHSNVSTSCDTQVKWHQRSSNKQPPSSTPTTNWSHSFELRFLTSRNIPYQTVDRGSLQGLQLRAN